MIQHQSSFLTTALCLHSRDIDALAQGKAIAAIARTFIRPAQQFVLYPHEAESLPLLTESQQLSLIASSQNQQLSVETIPISTWAISESCQILDQSCPIEKLAKATHWTSDELAKMFQQKQHLFLVCLRVFRFPGGTEMLANLAAPTSFGKFIGIPNSQTVTEFLPVLSDRAFAQRKQKLENLEPPDHPELEDLHDTIAQLIHPAAIHLEQDLKYFLGWAENAIVDRADSDLNWIQTIATIGNSSDGDTFEKIVRKGFIKLGFTNSRNDIKVSLDPNATGGAGGIDFYCEAPYAIVGECKASKTESVPDSTPAQLIKLGHKHLSDQEYDQAIKVIMAAGKLNHHAKQTAIGNKMNVLRPETLERLVDLKAKHPGAINLWELKPCLEQPPFGEDADQKVNQYLDRIQKDIEVRSRIVQLLQSKAPQILGVETIWGAYEFSNPPRPLTQAELKDILIELSSPLTGFIGRKDSDRFYFLRPLALES
ncbi:DUF1802 family protein [Leptolyngbya sp. AN03gr2]|uniref:DUF1802 family protein n=1 Tax=unclassified Leptolyngbya TaxID=2650499 RepID=UPI003D322B4F